MYIQEAILNTDRERPYISRRTWLIAGTDEIFILKILPTDTPDGCVMYSSFTRHGPIRGWQPRADDLKANDWFVCPPVSLPKKE